MASRRKTQQAPTQDVGDRLGSAVVILEDSVRIQERDEKAADKLEAKADKLEKKLDKYEKKLDSLEKKADAVEAKCDALEKKYDKLEAKLDKLEKKKDAKKKTGTGGAGEQRSLATRLAKIRTGIDVGRSQALLAVATVSGHIRLEKFKPVADDTDEEEARLDKNEKLIDDLEKTRDTQEAALDGLEKFLDGLEKNLDDAEKDFDQAEKLLDESSQDQPNKHAWLAPPGEYPGSVLFPLGITRSQVDDCVMSALLAQVRQGGARSRRAARTLERLGAAATPGLLRAYDSADEEHFRWEIVNLLGYTRDPRAVPLLSERGVQDTELHPRWRSIWALTSVDDGSAASRLRADLSRSTGVRRRNAAVALSLFEDRAAVPVLRRGLRAKDTWCRWESASCLVGFADPSAARDVLALYGGEDDDGVRQEMVRAVAGVKSSSVVSFLRERLRDRQSSVRSAAVGSLVQCANGQAARLLAARLRWECDRSVRKEIRDALASLRLADVRAGSSVRAAR